MLAPEEYQAESSRRGASTFTVPDGQQTPPRSPQKQETTREEAREAFLAMPLLPAPEIMEMEDVTAPLALLIDGPLAASVILLLAQPMTSTQANLV